MLGTAGLLRPGRFGPISLPVGPPCPARGGAAACGGWRNAERYGTRHESPSGQRSEGSQEDGPRLMSAMLTINFLAALKEKS